MCFLETETRENLAKTQFKIGRANEPLDFPPSLLRWTLSLFPTESFYFVHLFEQRQCYKSFPLCHRCSAKIIYSVGIRKIFFRVAKVEKILFYFLLENSLTLFPPFSHYVASGGIFALPLKIKSRVFYQRATWAKTRKLERMLKCTYFGVANTVAYFALKMFYCIGFRLTDFRCRCCWHCQQETR